MSSTNERLIGGQEGRLLVLLSIGFAVVRLGRRALPPLLPAIISDLSITPFQAGIALSVASLGFAVLQFPSGRLSDKLTRKTVILASLLILLLGVLFLSTPTADILLLGGIALMGSGEGLYGAADRGLVSDLFRKNGGQPLGFIPRLATWEGSLQQESQPGQYSSEVGSSHSSLH